MTWKYYVGIFVVFFLIGYGMSQCTMSNKANAGFLEKFSSINWEIVEPKYYKVEAAGYDFRVYEWKNKANKNCTVYFAENGSGIDCE